MAAVAPSSSAKLGTNTLAPPVARAMVKACPRPVLPPVTMAFLPRRPKRSMAKSVMSTPCPLHRQRLRMIVRSPGLTEHSYRKRAPPSGSTVGVLGSWGGLSREHAATQPARLRRARALPPRTTGCRCAPAPPPTVHRSPPCGRSHRGDGSRGRSTRYANRLLPAHADGCCALGERAGEPCPVVRVLTPRFGCPVRGVAARGSPCTHRAPRPLWIVSANYLWAPWGQPRSHCRACDQLHPSRVTVGGRSLAGCRTCKSATW